MGRQKQTKLPKNTHHIYKTHTLPLPSAFLPSSLVELFLSAFDFDSFLHHRSFRTLLSTPLHSSTRNQAVLSPPTSLAVWDQNHLSISLCPSMHFFPLWFLIYSLFISLLYKNCSCIEEGDTLFALFVLTSRANCDQLIPFPFSAKKPFLPLGGLIHCSVPAAKKSPHKKTVYQSRQSRRVLLCQATSVWVLPRITNFTNHSHHYTASTTRCKE